ncbi:MAG: helix-turn-helix domain-containing protein, partial [Bdellovibrionaceae bacterium]|nr:helix-turn-helix domain-containing protein [Pseudobdellovibrionaceae bacterium]
MKTTGQILKENRERKGITLNEVALATKINVKVLTAIEEGDSDRLPTKTFLRGFVRSYARYLGLDEEAILSSFYEEMGSTKPKLNVQNPEAPKTDAGERPLG